MTSKKTLLAAAMAAGLLVSVTACGGDDGNGDDNGGSSSEEQDTTTNESDGDDGASGLEDLSGSELAERALDATLAVESLAVNGEVSQQGETQAMSLRITTDGACEGSVAMGGLQAEFIHVDDVSYLKFPEEFAEQEGLPPELMDEVMGDRWVVPPAGEGADFHDVCDHTELFPDPDTDGEPEAEIVEGREIDGQATLGLRFEGEESVVYVLDDSDAPYFVHVAQEGVGEFTFSDFQEDFDIRAPAPEEVLDLSDVPLE